MTNPQKTGRLAAGLLQHEDPLKDSEYKEYRMRLEDALTSAERKERLTGTVAVACFAVALVLMFAGGSRVLGSFDPWSKDATFISVTLGVIYCIAAVVFWIALASYFSRFRPKTRQARENIRDASISELRHEISELRKQIEAISRDKNAN